MPSTVPYSHLLGHLPYFYKQDETNVWWGVNELHASGTSLARIVLGFTDFVSILHSKHVAAILKKPKTDQIYKLIKPWLGDGLLVSGGKKWFRNRKLLTPAFHYEILKGYIPVYNSCVSVLIDKWTTASQRGQPVQLFDSLSLASLDIIMQSAFSFQSHCQTTVEQHPYVKACSDLVYCCSDRMMNPIYMIDSIYWYTSHGRKTKKMCDFVHEHAENIIAKRKEVLGADESHATKKYLDFLDILLVARDEEGKGLSDLEIRNEVDTFMFEGHDTTTSGMSWTLYCLAQNPEHQEKIREEVRDILKGRTRLEHEDLKHLNYTMWCIKEAMRLYPPVFSFYRKTNSEIKMGEYTIPSDVIIAVSTFTIHRNPAIWENPAEFNPLRFHPDNVDKHGPYDYIPFSAGIRNCIGQVFAMNEMKVVIATLVNKFSFQVDETHPVEIIPRVVLRTKSDIKLVLKTL